jgi:AcrR family transcriptional regulator
MAVTVADHVLGFPASSVGRSRPYAGLVPTQAERTEATRARLVQTARLLFAEKGFAATSTEEILAAAAVSRGAMYHHFKGKRELFQTTFEAVEDDLTAKILAAGSTATDPMSQLAAGFDAFLGECRNPEVQRIVMLDGPTVLGWDTWHEIDQRHGFGAIKAVLAGAAELGTIALESVEPLAHLLLGALMQAGMVVARAEDPAEAKRSMTTTIARILAAL